MAEHLQAADADTAALQARLDALESETHSLREVLTERLKRDSLDEALPTGRGQRRSRDKPRGSRSSRGSFRPRSRSPEPPSGGRFRWVRGDDDGEAGEDTEEDDDDDDDDDDESFHSSQEEDAKDGDEDEDVQEEEDDEEERGDMMGEDMLRKVCIHAHLHVYMMFVYTHCRVYTHHV